MIVVRVCRDCMEFNKRLGIRFMACDISPARYWCYGCRSIIPKNSYFYEYEKSRYRGVRGELKA